MSADIEVSFRFKDGRKPIEGYRPSHLIDEKNFTTGVHHYYDKIEGTDELIGTIEFIAPEYYPGSLWIGKTIDMFDGSKKIGSATVRKIFNSILEQS